MWNCAQGGGWMGNCAQRGGDPQATMLTNRRSGSNSKGLEIQQHLYGGDEEGTEGRRWGVLNTET